MQTSKAKERQILNANLQNESDDILYCIYCRQIQLKQQQIDPFIMCHPSLVFLLALALHCFPKNIENT